MNKLFKSIGAFLLAMLGMIAFCFKSLFTFEGRQAVARDWAAARHGGARRGYRVRGLSQCAALFAVFACLLGMLLTMALSASASVVEFSTRDVIYLDSTGTNGCGFINGQLVNKRGETYTTNINVTLNYMQGANKTNSATFVNGVLTATNTVNP